MGKPYADKDWLHKKYVDENLKIKELAELCEVSTSTIEKVLQKYGIRKGHANKKKKPIRYVNEICSNCGELTQKSVQYYKRRIKEGKKEFYCSRKCADEAHSKRMSGKGNPNYDGKFHGKTMKDRTSEERKEIGRKVSETKIRKGSSRGKRNGRWAGGFTKFTCVICGEETYKRPYTTRKIKAGEQQPTCSRECASSLGRRNLQQESTTIEIAMASELKRRGITFIEQYNLGDKFRLDFLLPEYDIVIECDGDYWHNLPEVAKRDESKNAYIKACGFSLYRFWESEINRDIEACVDIVVAEINEKDAS